jgi:hypothetical protein
MLDEREQAHRVLRRVTGVADLDAIDPLLDQGGNTISSARLRRVSENRETAGALDQTDRIGHWKLVLRDESGTAVSEVPVERIAKIRRPSLGDHCARDVRPADRAARGLLEHRREVDADAELIEPNHHSLGAQTAHFTKRDETRFELTRVAQVQSQNVRFDLSFDGTQLDASHDAHAELLTGGDSLGDPRDGIVIGEGKRAEADALRLSYDVGGRSRAVRRGGMGVQVDEWPGRYAGRRRGHAE